MWRLDFAILVRDLRRNRTNSTHTYTHTHTIYLTIHVSIYLSLSSCCSVAQLCQPLCDPTDYTAHQASLSLTISWSLLKLMSIESVMPSNHLILCHPLLLPPSIFQDLFQWVSSLHQVAKVLELQHQHQSFQWIFRFDFPWNWLVWSPCCPRDSQESSPVPQLESINSLVLRLFYGPTLTSRYDNWKKP